jgi:hypothetical protein
VWSRSMRSPGEAGAQSTIYAHTNSDNGDPITGLFIVLAVSHGLVTVSKMS